MAGGCTWRQGGGQDPQGNGCAGCARQGPGQPAQCRLFASGPAQLGRCCRGANPAGAAGGLHPAGRRGRRSHAQAQQPPVGAVAAPEFHQHPPCARVARYPFAAAHGGERAALAGEPGRSGLRGRAPVHALGPARQHRLQDRRGRWLPGRARHPLPPAPGGAFVQKAGALDRGGRTGRDLAPVRPRHCRHRAAMAGAGGRAPAAKAIARSALGKEAGRGGRLRARHAVRPGGVQPAPHQLWQD
ncbi:hypothetical protein D3C72_1427990 [compost metagenome]